MQGVVEALAAAAQKGGVEGMPNAVDAETVATVSQQHKVVTPGPQQVQSMQLDTAVVPKPDAPNPSKKAKKAEKNPCFRCKKPGHQIDTCNAPVCDICESPNHISSACHLLQAPKPSVTMYGYAIEQLMFFELPTWGTYKPKVDNVKLVKVTVEGDPMSIPEIAECLRRIVPVENFQWEIYNFQNNVFRVKFPNKVESQRMKTFRTYPVPDRASDLIFEDWSALEDPLYMLPEKGNVQHVNNGKGVVGHQVQDQVKTPIVLGSLNTELLSQEEDNVGVLPQVDSAPGSVKIPPVSASGSVRPAAAVCSPLPLGSQRIAGASSLAAEPSPGTASPLAWSPRSPCRPQLSALSAPATLPLAGMAPAGGLGVAYASPCGMTREQTPVSHPLSPLAPTVVGPGRDAGQSTTEALGRALAAVSFRSSAASESVITSISSNKNTGEFPEQF
ncbi:hypothetical protein ACQ4PT_055187 [Festuca glaucescens]